MATILKLNDKTRTIIKASLNMEQSILDLGLNKWQYKLREFEKSHKISTEEFVSKFTKGKLGDDKKWFEWMFAYNAYNHVKEKLNAVKGIDI
ncbi:hypothetical protein HYU06_02055 [Candidatus Woesearchaeota archaeon]|nr:hypothetical protein [Candidatus Woesearchaeota archaeon]